jgi:hypothetical protein
MLLQGACAAQQECGALPLAARRPAAQQEWSFFLEGLLVKGASQRSWSARSGRVGCIGGPGLDAQPLSSSCLESGGVAVFFRNMQHRLVTKTETKITAGPQPPPHPPPMPLQPLPTRPPTFFWT